MEEDAKEKVFQECTPCSRNAQLATSSQHPHTTCPPPDHLTPAPRATTHLEVERLASLQESHANVRALSPVTLDTEDKVARRVEHGLDLGPGRGVYGLGEQLAGGRVLRMLSAASLPLLS